ncbi:MAG: tetratricopeptide repeat protein [Cyanothece sp. SIO1E1]|nr:tetratricopeptide repeat protein [Cyanothece sp. SIO1E1]
MPNLPALRDRYLESIDEIVRMTLKGKIRSKQQVYRLLTEQVSTGTGEIFERCLADRLMVIQRQIEIQTDELKLAKANRSLRALETIQGEWERWQVKNQATALLTTAAEQILTAAAPERLTVFLRIMDPNRNQALNRQQWQQLAKSLQQQSAIADAELAQQELQQLAEGITRGLAAWQKLEPHLVSWLYDQGQGQLGFAGLPTQRGPWQRWSEQVESPLPQTLFRTLALEQSVAEGMAQQVSIDLADWVELAVLLRCLQQGLVNWFDQLVYDSKVGAKLSIATFLAFAIIWSQLARGFNRATSLSSPQGARLVNGCFQITLQILRTFAQRPYFPLYGGIFVSFSGAYLRDTLNYLDEPLKWAEGTQEKARILILLGYSQRAQGQYQRALQFYQQALDIAQSAGDRPCEIAALNHLSRTDVAQQSYASAINYSQRAIILSRQLGDRLGEANALANLGYSQVFQAQQLEQSDPEIYETAINYLQQGLQLAEKLGDRQSQALCFCSLGIAHVTIAQPQSAIAYLESGAQAAQFSGDFYLQGLNLAYLAEAHHRLHHSDQAIHTACLGMYLLDQIASREWRQPAGLLTVLRGQLGDESFQALLMQQRPKIISVIGVDGYDYIPELLRQYQAE